MFDFSESGNGPYFPVFGLNTEICGVNLRIQSEYKKTRTRKISPYLDTFNAVTPLKGKGKPHAGFFLKKYLTFNYSFS